MSVETSKFLDLGTRVLSAIAMIAISVAAFWLGGYWAIGFIGLGNRGPGAVLRMPHIEGTEVTAICDKRQPRVDNMLGLKASLNGRAFEMAGFRRL